MKQAPYRQPRETDDMDTIDVRDLPEEQAQLVVALERDWAAGADTSFAKDWENKEDAIYDTWREHYHRRAIDRRAGGGRVRV